MGRFGRGEQLQHVLALSLGRRTASREIAWMKSEVKKLELESTSKPVTLEKMVQIRAQGTPLAYVLGNQPFGPLTIKVQPPVLIPRTETEDWTIRLADLLSSPAHPISLLDVCTGSGCIPTLVCHLLLPGNVQAVAVDLADEAISLATINAKSHGFAGPHSSHKSCIKVKQGDLFDQSVYSTLLSARPTGNAFDVLTCNPPYIPQCEYDRLPSSVRNHEDKRALLDQENGDGLAFYRRLVEILQEDKRLSVNPNTERRLVKTGGLVVVEHGDGQSESVQQIFLESKVFSDIEGWKDQYGRYRVVKAVIG